MDQPTSAKQPAELPRIELISVYINSYFDLAPDRKAAFQAEFLRRGLPLPAMPAERPPARPPAVPKKGVMERSTFLSYILLIYTATAVVYSWIFLVARLFRHGGGPDARHQKIQTAIAAAYAIAELIALQLLILE